MSDVGGCAVFTRVSERGGEEEFSKISPVDLLPPGIIPPPRLCLCHLFFVVFSFRVQVTCPGVILSKKSDVHLSVCMLGQHRKTPRLAPVFPLLFHHRMVFAKVSCVRVSAELC